METHLSSLFAIAHQLEFNVQALFRNEQFQGSLKGVLRYCPQEHINRVQPESWRRQRRQPDCSKARKSDLKHRAVKDLRSRPIIDTSLTDIWSSKADAIKEEPKRIKSLLVAYQKNVQNTHLAIIKRRLILLLIEHEIQVLKDEVWNSIETDAELHIAVHCYAETNDLSAEDIKGIRRQAAHLLLLAKVWGIGAIVVPGGRSLWEGGLTEIDLVDLWKYCEGNLPEIPDCMPALNTYVERLLLNTVQAYRGNEHALKAGKTRLSRYILRDCDGTSFSCEMHITNAATASATLSQPAEAQRVPHELQEPPQPSVSPPQVQQTYSTTTETLLTAADQISTVEDLSSQAEFQVDTWTLDPLASLRTPYCAQLDTHQAYQALRRQALVSGPLAKNSFLHRVDIRTSACPGSEVPRLLCAPQSSNAERLLHVTSLYFQDKCRDIRLDVHGTLLGADLSEWHNDLCDQFDSYCFTATRLYASGAYVEFRDALSKACFLVKPILENQHPRTLACFFEVLIHFMQNEFFDLAFMLRRFIADMSARVLEQGSPWAEILQLLAQLDSESLEQGMAQTWNCAVNTFESALGTSGRLVVSSRLDYVKRVYGHTNYLHEEQLLREVLAKFDDSSPRGPIPRILLNLAHNLNKQGSYERAEEEAQKVLSMLQRDAIYADRHSERIECQKIIAHSHFNRGNPGGAQQTMTHAIVMLENQRGRYHPWVLEFKTVLQGWLRHFGQDEAADDIQRDIQSLLETTQSAAECVPEMLV